MSTSQATMDYLLDQLSGLPNVTSRKMFGEYCLYVSGKPVALVCDEQLFLKPTKAGRSIALQAVEALPYPGAKPHLLITADLWDDHEWLSQLIQATDSELPLPKPRKKKV